MKGGDTCGSMPFAIVAVTILLLSVAAAAVTAEYARSSDNADDAATEMDSIDAAIANVTDYVNRGLGEIVRSVSVDADIGGLDERSDIFDERTSEWIAYQFPIISDGVTVEQHGHRISLSVENMGISDPEGEGYTPTYLKGSGTVDVLVRSEHGRTETSITIYTDGSYSLPLVAERGTMLESMASGGGISLTQMMTYQLTALAQYRAVNGHADAYTLISSEDVSDAYGMCIDVITDLCFRDGELSSRDRVDIADLLIAEDGTLELDLSAIYAQALASAADDIALQWMDYLYGYEILELLSPPRYEALESLIDWIRGEEVVSGVPYLREKMSLNGFDEDSYRFPGSGSTTVTVDGVTVTVTNPTMDLFSQSWLCDFKREYKGDDDYVREYIKDIVRGAAVSVAERSDLEMIIVDIDPYDGTSMMDSITDAISSAMEGCIENVSQHLGSSLSSSVTYDEFYSTMAEEVMLHAEDMALTEDLFDNIRSAFVEEMGEISEEELESIMDSKAVGMALESYRSKVYSDLSKVESLRYVEDGTKDIVKDALTVICSYGLEILDILTPVDSRMEAMVDEMIGINGTNPYGGTIGLDGKGGFELEDQKGNRITEVLTSDVSTESLSVTIAIDRDRCTHTTGFREDLSAAYSTVLLVDLHGIVDYSVTGAGSLAQAMGTISSSYRDSFVVDTTIQVVIATGWALSGIEYVPTNTILGDVWEQLLILLEPIIEPLRTVLETIRQALTVLGEAIMEAVGFVSQYVIQLYELLMDPLEELVQMMEDFIEDIVQDAVFNVLFGIGLGKQHLDFVFFGCTLVFSTSAITWNATTKSVLSVELTMPVAGMELKAGVNVKIRGAVDPENLILTFSGSIKGDDWSVKVKMDPLMKSSKHLVTLDGKIGKNTISLVAPELENYCEMGLRLSDTPVGEVLDNIPVPMLGAKVGLDAGFTLRYTEPTVRGIIINEYECNPEGDDKGNEWVEILNNTNLSVDLEGYTLIVNTGKRDQIVPLGGELSPGEFLVVPSEYTLTNDGSDTLRLLDAGGVTVDRVEMDSDSGNDGRTYQRDSDGGVSWVLKKGTMGSSNEGEAIAGIHVEDMKSYVWNAVVKAFDDVPEINGVDTLCSYIEYLVRYTLEGIIDGIADQIVDASIFVSVDVRDVTETSSTGIRVALRTDGDLVRDCLRYLAGKVQSLLLGVNDPYSIDPLGMFTENIDLEVCLHAGIGFPELLSKGIDDLPEMDLNVIVRTNLAALSRLVDIDSGRPGIEFGIMVRDCPEQVIPSKLSPKKNLDHDLWLFRVTMVLT